MTSEAVNLENLQVRQDQLLILYLIILDRNNHYIIIKHKLSPVYRNPHCGPKDSFITLSSF